MNRYWLYVEVPGESAQAGHVMASNLRSARILLKPHIQEAIRQGHTPKHISETPLTSLAPAIVHPLEDTSHQETDRTTRRTGYRRYWHPGLHT